MKNERRNKRLYKIISCVVVFLVCVFAFVSLAICKASNNKVNAGVIIESSYTRYVRGSQLTIKESTNDNMAYSYGIPYVGLQSIGSNGVQLCQLYNEDFSVLIGTLFVYSFRFDFSDVSMRFQRGGISSLSNGTFVQIGLTTINYNSDDIDTYVVFDLTNIFAGIRGIGNNDNVLNNLNYTMSCSSFGFNGGYFFQKANTIKSSKNIFDVERNTLTLLYLSDISGLNTSEMRDEITINWGYIDQSDNTLYAEYAPTISAQNLITDDNKIRLGLPVNAQGDAMQYYDISQQAILSISGISTGSATATANIYGVYVWRNENNIKWGLANFNTATNPQSAMSMNYITSFTELFDFQNVRTATMTCRLSVSNNFNFITIKNQTSVNVDNVNAVIQQGGFLPAWAVYNWARGTYSGFIAGEASASAEYQEGMPKYDAIYQAGYKAGFDSAEIGTGAWFITAFNAVDRFLNIHIFPNITFGVLLGIPFVISLAWFIIRMFRGGGGD